MGNAPQWDKLQVVRDDGRSSARWYHWIAVAILGFAAGIGFGIYLGMQSGSRRNYRTGVRHEVVTATSEDVTMLLLICGAAGAVVALIGFAAVKFQSAAEDRQRAQERAERKAAAKRHL